MRSNAARFSTEQLARPPPPPLFRNPLSAPAIQQGAKGVHIREVLLYFHNLAVSAFFQITTH